MKPAAAKFFSIVLALYYAFAVIGVAISVHYCHNGIEAIGIYTDTNGCCDDEASCCTCCVDEQYVVKADVDDQLAVSNKFKIFQSGAGGVSMIPGNDTYQPGAERHYFDHADHELPHKPPLWLLNCTLTFYG